MHTSYHNILLKLLETPSPSTKFACFSPLICSLRSRWNKRVVSKVFLNCLFTSYAPFGVFHLLNCHHTTAHLVRKSVSEAERTLRALARSLYHKHSSSSLEMRAQATRKEGLQAPPQYAGRRRRGILGNQVKVEQSDYLCNCHHSTAHLVHICTSLKLSEPWRPSLTPCIISICLLVSKRGLKPHAKKGFRRCFSTQGKGGEAS